MRASRARSQAGKSSRPAGAGRHRPPASTTAAGREPWPGWGNGAVRRLAAQRPPARPAPGFQRRRRRSTPRTAEAVVGAAQPVVPAATTGAGSQL